MPLKSGTSEETRAYNIREMIKAGHPPAQAVAAAYAKQRESRGGGGGGKCKSCGKKPCACKK